MLVFNFGPIPRGTFAADAPAVTPLPDRDLNQLEAFYHDLHMHPELSLHEEKTAARFAKEVKDAGYDVTTNVGGHGVVAVLKNGPGKTLLIRTDLDALPVKEETGAAYASKDTGVNAVGATVSVMHACGHDIHITTMVGVARTMVANKDKWTGTLVLIGQPGEEVGKGSAAMLKDGLFTRFPRPDWCLALHVDSELETGKVGYTSGFFMANMDAVDVTIRGLGGHGAMPQNTKDPIVLAAQTIMAWQTIVSRENRAMDPVVVTVGSIHGGTKHNIIPDEVKLQLTVRTYKEDVRKKVLASIERIARGQAIAAGLPEDRMPTMSLKDDEFTPATYNSPELVARVVKVFQKTLGEENVIERQASMGAEDFSRYGMQEPKIPIFMFRLGSIPASRVAEAKKAGVALPGLHSSKYLPDARPSIQTGVKAMSAAAVDLLAK
jgi:hippurate hydrolase